MCMCYIVKGKVFICPARELNFPDTCNHGKWVVRPSQFHMILFSCIIFTFNVRDKAKADWDAIWCHGKTSKWEVISPVAKQREEQEQETFCFDGLTPQALSLRWRRKQIHVLKGLILLWTKPAGVQGPLMSQACICALWLTHGCHPGGKPPVVFCSIGNHPRFHGQGTRSVDRSSSK